MTTKFRKLAPSEYRRMPWKNGKGVTVEIASFPENTTLDGFGWRVSMASVTENGPFSSFPGVDRTLSVLSGKGLLLAVEGAEPTQLTPDTAPHAFPADQPTYADLLGGPVEDFNVMTRRGEWTHRVSVVERDEWRAEVSKDAVALVHAWRGDAEVRAGEIMNRLGEAETCIIALDRLAGVSVTPCPTGRAYVVMFERVR